VRFTERYRASEALRWSSASSRLRLSREDNIGQSAISLSVRLQPRHQPVTSSIRQTDLQGEGGACMPRSMRIVEVSWQ
jgi:hypothetical protein